LLASAARNRGAEKAKGQYIFFIDDDNRVEAGVVDVLASLLDKQPQLVEVGPAMYYADDPERVYCLGASHHGLFGRTRWILQPPTDNSHQVKSDTLPNAFMVRRREFEGIGGFDEDYFPMEFEESDLAFRLREQYGGYVACSTEARIWHHAPLLVLDRLAAKSMARSYYSARNRPIFIARHFGIGQWIEFLFVGQFLAASTRLSGVCFGPNQTGRSQAAIVCAYMAGMVVGLLISVDEILRPFRSRMRLRGLRNQARRMRG
jgi:GT2 family glycosyltransferase